MQTIRPIATFKIDTNYFNSSNSSTAEQSPLSFNDNYFNRQSNFLLPERMFSPSPSHFQLSNDSTDSFHSFNSLSFDLKTCDYTNANIYCGENNTKTFDDESCDDEMIWCVQESPRTFSDADCSNSDGFNSYTKNDTDEMFDFEF